MHVSFSDEHEAFREEVRAFLAEHLTDELRQAQRDCPGIFLDYEHNIRWHRILHARGWVAPSWPKEYGGTGWDLTRRYIWTTECTLAGAPSTAPMGLGMCGPMLIGHGTPEQRAYYLPRILSGEDYWCQGYSEPGSGSDLASLALKADRDGDEFVLNGSKIWTTHAHYANRMFCLVRTRAGGKPQDGITFLLLDMDTPGIRVEPIVFASGTHEVNQVFFDNVRVPVGNVVGAVDKGWTVAKYLLEFERGGGGIAAQQTALKRVRRLAAAVAADGRSLLDDAAFRRKLDAADVRLQAIQYAEFRTMARLSRGQNPGPESSIMKNLSADMGQHLTELALEATGYTGMTLPNAGGGALASGEGSTAFLRYFNLRASSIAGGTNEVQKNIVAKLVLGL
ncbi:MAG: acyl-CoA dehydrogenase family protein [Pseudomonadales bacterium]|nr:acyl-CoA dehydrogenase family protein [Pseudomonadales bacterium]MCP5184390.1 acyl-CoA dehydrogenase family protein [Pseudomonadales bacterium]